MAVSNLSTPFVWGRGGSRKTPDQLERERRIADALMARGMDFSPVDHPLQGLARVANAAVGAYRNRQVEDEEQANAEYSAGLLDALLGRGQDAAAQAPVEASAVPAVEPITSEVEVAALPPIGQGEARPMQQYRDAIAGIESAGSGDYAAIGPTDPQLGRALGRYQIMEANLGPWSREALGREVTADEFLANPELQDRIFDHRFGQYVQQYGPEGAAQAWFAGPGGVGALDRRDSLGTSVADYTDRFNAALGAQPAAAADPIQRVAAVMPAAAPQPAQASPAQSIVPALVGAMTDPRVSPEVRQIASVLFQQQMQQNDPMRRLQMDYMQERLEQLRNPQVPETVRALQMRAEMAGLQPGTPEYAQFMLSSGGPSVSVDARQMGNIPPGYRMVYDAEGRPVSMEPIPGSPAARELEEAEQQRADARERKEQGANVVIQDIDRALRLMDESTLPVTGLVGAGLANVPGTAAHDINNLLDSVRAASAFERLQQMREDSPTGGALGQVTERELALLQAAIGSLQQSQSAQQFGDNLRRVRNTFLDIIHGPGQGPERSPLSFEDDLPEGVTEDDIRFTMEKHGLSREEVLRRISGGS